MSAERERTVALRWGLVALGAIGYGLVRASIALLSDVIAVSPPKVRPLVVAQRISQLKPMLWKASHMRGYLYVTLAMGAAILGVMLYFAVREIVRDEERS